MILLGLILIVVAAGAGTLLFLAAQQATDRIRLEARAYTASIAAPRPADRWCRGDRSAVAGPADGRGSIRRKARRRREAKELQRQAELDAEARRRQREGPP